jgi:actin
VLSHAVTRLPVGGSHLLQYLRQLLTKSGHQCTVRVAQQIKETMLHVSRDGRAGLEGGTLMRLYQPDDPDDDTCAVDGPVELCFQVPEALFRPSLLALDAPGLVGCIQASMDLCDPGVRAEVFGNMLLCGGLSQLPHLRDRLASELRVLIPDTAMDVTAPREGSHSAWIGGSIATSSSLGSTVSVSREDRAEQGSAAILRMSPDLN